MQKVLSIDLDYIMWPDINYYNCLLYDHNPTERWIKMQESENVTERRKYEIDQANLMFVYNVFLKAIRQCKSVSFAYEHDAILYELEKEKYQEIDLYHIDHHDDYINGSFQSEGYEGFAKEYYFVEKQNRLDEGNWGAWLKVHNKLKSFLWIHNPNTTFDLKCDKIKYIHDSMDGEFYMHHRDEVVENLQKTKYDHVFVCLSPQYIPPNHWHYFGMFISAYKEMTGLEPLIHIKKYGRINELNAVHDKIINNYS